MTETKITPQQFNDALRIVEDYIAQLKTEVRTPGFHPLYMIYPYCSQRLLTAFRKTAERHKETYGEELSVEEVMEDNLLLKFRNVGQKSAKEFKAIMKEHFPEITKPY